MYHIGLNDYDESAHWTAINERNVYLSYTGDYSPNYLNHMHMTHELLLVEAGSAQYTINNVDYRIGQGDLFIIGSMDPHVRQVVGFPFIRYGLTLMPGYIDSLPIVNEHPSIYRTQSPDGFTRLKDLDDDSFATIRTIFLALGEESTSMRAGHSDMSYALLLQLTIVLTRLLNADKSTAVHSSAYQEMLKIRNYIDTNFSEELSLSDLSHVFFLGPTTISRNFASCFGVSLSHYISAVRITHATRLLENSAASVTELALRVGYGSVNTFIRQFSRKMGVSPLQYRKQFLQCVHDRKHPVPLPG